MDESLILDFTSEEQAQSCLSAINSMMADYWSGQGYTVLTVDGEKQLVGKNAATGADEPASARTIAWDQVMTGLAGHWYFSSPSNDAKFADKMADLSERFDFVEKDFAPEVDQA